MSRTIYYTASSLDGFLATDDHSLDWLLSQPTAPELEEEMAALGSRFGAQVMGASTYEWVLRHEDMLNSAGSWPYASPTWVMTHRDLPAVPGADLTFARGDVADVHAQMRAAAGDRDLWVLGGGELAGQFADAGLLDEIEVTFAPVTLGSGAPLLPRRIDLELREVRHVPPFMIGRFHVGRA